MSGPLRAWIAPVRGLLLLGVLLDLGAVAATIGQAAALSQIVEPVLLHAQGLASVGPPAAVLIALTLVRAGLLWVREVAGQQAAVGLASRLRRRLVAHLLRLGPSYVQGERAGELAATATDGVERLEPYVSRYLPQVALSVLGPALVLTYVAWLDWVSAGLLLLTAPVIPLLMVAVGSYAEEHVREQWAALGRMRAYLLDVLQGLPTLQAFGRAETEGGRVAAVSEAFRTRTLQVLRYAFLSGLVLELLTTAGIALVAVTLGLRLLDGAIAFAPAFQVLLLAPEFFRPLRELGASRHAALEARPAAERIQAILELPEPDRPGRPPRRPLGRPLTVELAHLEYRYPGAPAPALSGVCLELPAASRTALVGPSGAGKSTLASLLLRFVEPTQGAILANGQPIAALPVETWRAQVALVPQRPYLFDVSALDNIRLARPTASLDEVMRAAELAGAHPFLEQLPHGYGTRLGERGLRLSQGQAQRIAIARAFLKDAPLLVLDEPTSALDPESEDVVRTALEDLANGRTVLVIAHRLKTVYTADQIVVLRDGQLVEQGTHRALVARGGHYAHLAGERLEPVR